MALSRRRATLCTHPGVVEERDTPAVKARRDFRDTPLSQANTVLPCWQHKLFIQRLRSMLSRGPAGDTLVGLGFQAELKQVLLILSGLKHKLLQQTRVLCVLQKVVQSGRLTVL